MTTSTLALVERAHDSLLVGYAAESATARHHAAQIAALRAAAAVVAARDRRDRSSSLGPVSLDDACASLPAAIVKPRYEFDKLLAEADAPVAKTAAAPAAVPPAPTPELRPE